jgi:DNA polymerase III, subunit gamma and tau
LGSLGMSFANLMNEGKKEEKHEEEVEITNKDEHQSFTWQELIVEWKGMCNRIAKLNVSLAQRMKLIKPQILPDGNIEVVVGNKILLDEMQTIRGRIRATMAQRLHNGQIDVMLRLAKAEELKPILTPRQELEKMQQQNPSIAKLIEQLGLQLE